MIPTILQTKLHIPPLRSGLVLRHQLHAKLDANVTASNDFMHKLTLVSAPAGFGKSTLIANWAHGQRDSNDQIGYCWVSLDQGDNEPIRFWSYVVAALRTTAPDFAMSIQTILQSDRSPADDIVRTTLPTTLINELVSVDGSFVLILDDFHLVTSTVIHESLAFLIDHAPTSFHLMLITRRDPLLPLARMRAQSQLFELRAQDLRFTQDEMVRFFQGTVEVPLSSEQIIAVDERTEGWIAGIQLAALSLRSQENADQFIANFAGSNRYILDYLVDEVLVQQPSDIQRFLLYTSILERMSAPLCDTLLRSAQESRLDGFDQESQEGERMIGDAVSHQSQTILQELEEANLFIIPLDTERQWYRYHHLFADLLRHRLRNTHREQIETLHRRACDWLAAHRFADEAMQHAIALGDENVLGELIERFGEQMFGQGEIVTILRWFDALTTEYIGQHPYLAFLKAWAHGMLGHIQAAESLLECIESSEEAEDFRGEVAALRGTLALADGNVDTGIEYLLQAWNLLEENHALMGATAVSLGVAHEVRGATQDAVEAFSIALRIGRQTNHLSTSLIALSMLASLQNLQGELWAAHELYQQALETIADQKNAVPGIASVIYIGYAQLLYLRNDLDGAENYIRQGLRYIEHTGQLGNPARAFVTSALVEFANHNVQAAFASLTRGERVLDRLNLSYYKSHIDGYRARLHLRSGNMRAAVDWLQSWQQSGPQNRGHRYEGEMLTAARIFAAQGNQEQALALVTQVEKSTEVAGRKGRLSEARLLKALIAWSARDEATAFTLLEQVLLQAEPAWTIRPFIDEGESMRSLLVQWKKSSNHHMFFTRDGGQVGEYVDNILKAFPHQDEEASFSTTHSPDRHPSTPPSPASSLIEPLSDREIDVLRLLAQGLSNQQMADQLIIAHGTVKRHLANIYGKLGVNNRTQAVATARDLNLL